MRQNDNYGRAGRAAIATCAAVVALIATPAFASSIQVSGTTAGCFGSGCSDFASSAEYEDFGLTFTGTTFDVMTDEYGNADGIWLGTLARGQVNVGKDLGSIPFTLEVSFGVPTVSDELFTALIVGTSVGGGGPLDVDFDNDWQTVYFNNSSGSGSFEFAVNDLDLTKNGEGGILGGIRNVSYSSLESQPTPVPEPASIALFGSGMLLLARRLRGRRPSSES